MELYRERVFLTRDVSERPARAPQGTAATCLARGAIVVGSNVFGVRGGLAPCKTIPDLRYHILLCCFVALVCVETFRSSRDAVNQRPDHLFPKRPEYFERPLPKRTGGERLKKNLFGRSFNPECGHLQRVRVRADALRTIWRDHWVASTPSPISPSQCFSRDYIPETHRSWAIVGSPAHPSPSHGAVTNRVRRAKYRGPGHGCPLIGA